MEDAAPIILKFPRRSAANEQVDEDPVVITGVGIAASVGSSRESVWKAIQTGRSGIRLTRHSDCVGDLRMPCGMVDWLPTNNSSLKSVQLSKWVAAEALGDAAIDWESVDRYRFACSVASQFGDIDYVYQDPESRDQESGLGHRWWNEFLPSSASGLVAKKFGLFGPRLCHATACASGLISTMAAARMIQEDQADYALCGAADAVTELVFTAFNRMGVLSSGPEAESACRPFDETRSGFVMGEGAAMLVLEKKSHAIGRGARIYAELAGSCTLGQAHHVTGLDGDTETLTRLVSNLVAKAGWEEQGPQYINAHGTGTLQNDACELRAIRSALGSKADDVRVSSTKGVLGHLINAAGSIELALTAMALRDGFAPPTMHLSRPIGDVDCLAMQGERADLKRALKLSLAFGGHLVGMALRKCPEQEYQREARPLCPNALVRDSSQELGVLSRAA